MSVFGVTLVHMPHSDWIRSLVRIFPHSDWIRRDREYLSVFSQNAGKCRPEWLRIRTLLRKENSTQIVTQHVPVWLFEDPSLLTCMTWSQSFLCENLTMILLLLFMRRWHFSISREEISQPTLINIYSTLDSTSSLDTSRGMPLTSKQSLLEYWTFAQHCLSISTTLLLRSVLTFLTILISDSS